MAMQPIEPMLRDTLVDGRLSRGEAAALRALIADWGLEPARLNEVRQAAFALAGERLPGMDAEAVLGWLADVVRLTANLPPAATGTGEACFSPGDACAERLANLLRAVRKTADICVFTISDDRISREIEAAHRRGVRVRIISDNEKMHDLGSDIERLAAAGIAVRIDESDGHMHHKFALLDGTALVTGSYNWTRSAAAMNCENFVILPDAGLIAAFQAEFERLWAEVVRV